MPFVLAIKNTLDPVFVEKIAQIDEGCGRAAVIAVSGCNLYHFKEIRNGLGGGRVYFETNLKPSRWEIANRNLTARQHPT